MVECIKHEEDVSDRGKPGENPARYRHCVSVLPISQNTDREACVRKRRVTASATRRARAPSACLRSEYGLRGPRQTRGRAAFVLLSFFCEANVRKEKEDSERTCKHACGDSAAGLGPLAGRRALPGPRARCSLGCRRRGCGNGAGKRAEGQRGDAHRREGRLGLVRSERRGEQNLQVYRSGNGEGPVRDCEEGGRHRRLRVRRCVRHRLGVPVVAHAQGRLRCRGGVGMVVELRRRHRGRRLQDCCGQPPRRRRRPPVRLVRQRAERGAHRRAVGGARERSRTG